MAREPRDRQHRPRSLELRAFCTEGAGLDGQAPLAAFERLAGGLYQPPGDAQAHWQARGEAVPMPGGAPQWWLHLQARAPVMLQCQRCLQPLTHELRIDRRFRFVANEDEAERLDEQIDDDVLVLEPRFDLMALLEDELLLALPLVPRHEPDCPEPLDVPVGEPVDQTEPERPNPFAALAALRQGGGQG